MSYSLFTFICLYVFFKCLFLRERGRERGHSGGKVEREGETESEVGSRLWAVLTEPDLGLELTNYEIMTWAEVRPPTDWATQVPLISMYLKKFPLVSSLTHWLFSSMFFFFLFFVFLASLCLSFFYFFFTCNWFLISYFCGQKICLPLF